jgi:hypothetical protein
MKLRCRGTPRFAALMYPRDAGSVPDHFCNSIFLAEWIPFACRVQK